MGRLRSGYLPGSAGMHQSQTAWLGHPEGVRRPLGLNRADGLGSSLRYGSGLVALHGESENLYQDLAVMGLWPCQGGAQLQGEGYGAQFGSPRLGLSVQTLHVEPGKPGALTGVLGVDTPF